MGPVVHPADVEPETADGAEVRVTFDGHLQQRIVTVRGGRARPTRPRGTQEVLYVAAGGGTLQLNGDSHRLEPDTGVFVAPDEEYVLDAEDELVLVSVVAPADRARTSGERKVTVRFADQPELPASKERTFKYLVNQDTGCFDVTQFVGIVQPSKAPFHSHTYDEVGYIVEGEGFAHIDGDSLPLRPGSCFHLAPDQPHCIENSGTTVMRILGVFHPSGDPSRHQLTDNK